MKILLFHPVTLPPKNYGGVERVVLWLAKGLKETGHEVWVAALEGSRLPEGIHLLPVPASARSAHFLLRKEIPHFDLIHFMAPPEKDAHAQLRVPSIVTIHGNGVLGEVFPKCSVFLTRNHAERHGSKEFVHNGLDPAEFRFEASKSNSFLFFSKTSWKVKNLKGAIDACRSAGVHLNIAGGSRPWFQRLRALVFGFKWLGPVADRSKAAALSQARALVFPILWDEPFGLVMVEAWLSGTPVIAYARGSVPELMQSHMGVIVSSEQELVSTLQTWDSSRWNAQKIRETALERFSYKKMTASYELFYRRAIGGEKW